MAAVTGRVSYEIWFERLEGGVRRYSVSIANSLEGYDRPCVTNCIFL